MSQDRYAVRNEAAEAGEDNEDAVRTFATVDWGTAERGQMTTTRADLP